MRFMNTWEIADAREQYAGHPILGPATQTLANLEDWTNSHSDGWHIWPKPTRAAARLMELIQRDGGAHTWAAERERQDVTAAEYKAALRPIKAFRTRQNADFDILEAEDS